MITHLDHLVLTVQDIQRTIAFYSDVLEMTPVIFKGRHALAFGNQKINLHEVGKEFEPKAARPQPGSADLCFISDVPLSEFCQRLTKKSIAIVEGPVSRTGAVGEMVSVYFRDPDGNLIEISNYLHVPKE